ncbi:transglycosylase SLT domain-containing protein [Bdellovibrionota bacterium FG-2]
MHIWLLIGLCMMTTSETVIASDSTLDSTWGAFTQKGFQEWEQMDRFVKKMWDEQPDFDSIRNFIAYADDAQSRIVIDYEKGVLSFESFQNGAKTTGSLDKFLQRAQKEKLLEAAEIDLKAVENARKNITSDTIEGQDHQLRTVLKVRIPLAAGHVLTRAKRYLPIVEKYAAQFDVDPTLILAVIRQESSFNPRARSRVGALGLMQIMPQYAGVEVLTSLTGDRLIPTSEFLFDPDRNIMVGTKYLQLLLTRYQTVWGSGRQTDFLATCSYNWGPERVMRAIETKRVHPSSTSRMVYEELLAVVPLETSDYLRKVTQYREEFRRFLAVPI